MIVSRQLTNQDAVKICDWRYEKPYDAYNVTINDRVISEFLKGEYFAIEINDEMIGYFCIGGSAKVPVIGDIDPYSDKGYIDVGLGIKPSLTGKGDGKRYFEFVLNEAKIRHPDKNIRLTVASFNLRAIKLYENFGFVKDKIFIKKFLKSEREFITMKLKLD